MKLLTLAWLACLTFLLITDEPVVLRAAERFPGLPYQVIDSAAHILAFTVLAILFWATDLNLSFRRRLLLLGLLAVGAELVQVFLPARSAEIGDLLSNLVGVLAGSSLYWLARSAAALARREPAASDRVPAR